MLCYSFFSYYMISNNLLTSVFCHAHFLPLRIILLSETENTTHTGDFQLKSHQSWSVFHGSHLIFQSLTDLPTGFSATSSDSMYFYYLDISYQLFMLMFLTQVLERAVSLLGMWGGVRIICTGFQTTRNLRPNLLGARMVRNREK